MKKIAIIKLSAMGDIIHTMVVLQFIKKAYPDMHITWFVEQMFAKVLEHNPHIDVIIKLNLKSLKKDKKLLFSQIKYIKSFKKQNYDLVIDAQGLLKSAIVAKMVGKNVAGFCKNSTREALASLFYNHKISIAYEENIIDRNAYLFSKALGLNITKDDLLKKKPYLFYKDEDSSIYDFFTKDAKNIVLVLGASWASKIYPKEGFKEVIDGLDENFLLLWANENEREMALFLAQNTKAKMLPKMDLNTLKALISKADLLIGNDTGPTHMAWANNVSSITLFGNTPAYRNTYETAINKTLKSNSNVDALRLNRQDYSIKTIDKNDIINLSKKLLKNGFDDEIYLKKTTGV